MAAVPAQSRDEFGPSPIEHSVLRFLTTHRSCAVWDNKDPGALKCRGHNDELRKQCPIVVDDRIIDIVKRGDLEFIDHTSASLLIMLASHKQMLMQYTVGSPMYKHISALLKYVEHLHRITAKLPLEETDEANPNVAEDTGRPSTGHSHGHREFPPPPHASPSPEIPLRTTHAVPDLEIPLPTAHASSHPEIPSHTSPTFFDPAHFSFTPPSFDLGYGFSQTPPVMHTQSPLDSIGHIDHVPPHSHSISFMPTPGLRIDPMTMGVTHISSATPSSPAVVGSPVVGSQAKQPDVHVDNEQIVVGLQLPLQGRPKRTTKAPPCGTGGHKAGHKVGPTVKLDCPDEFLTSIHGHYGCLNEWGPVFVRSLSFESNRKTYEPFGTEQGTYFSFPMAGGKIVGFHGKSGWYLDAIGAYLKLVEKQYSSNVMLKSESYVANGTEKVGYSVIQGSVGENFDIVLAVRQKDEYGNPLQKKTRGFSTTEYNKVEIKEKVPSIEKVPSRVDGAVTYGPWGGIGGSTFDDGTYTGIRQINLSRNVGIVWIRALYDCDGDAIWGNRHGGSGGFKNEKIIFDFPSEVLTHIVGSYGPLMYMGPSVISFATKLKEGKIVGIHGRKGLFLDALGVHVIEGKIMPLNHCTSNAIIPYEPAVFELDNPHWSNKLALARQVPSEEENCGLDNGSIVYGFAFVDCAALRIWVGSINDDVSSAAKGALLMQLTSYMFSYAMQLNLQCVEERMRGLISNLIRLSKQRVDIEKPRH
nr:isoform 3 of jacalin-related lectin 3 [Quercus suber]